MPKSKISDLTRLGQITFKLKEIHPKNNFDPFLGQKYFYDPLGGIKKFKMKNDILAFLSKTPKKYKFDYETQNRVILM